MFGFPSAKPRKPTRYRYQPAFEELEDRRMLATMADIVFLMDASASQRKKGDILLCSQ